MSGRTFVFKTPSPYGELLAEPWVVARGDYDYTWFRTWDDAWAAAVAGLAA